jgi:threonine dehydratase
MAEIIIPEKNIAAIVSGGNIDPSALSQVLRRGLVRQGRLSRLAVTVDDRPGGLASITKVLAEKGANVVEVHHQRGSLHTTFGETKVDFEIETRGPDHLKGIIGSLTQAGFSVETDA